MLTAQPAPGTSAAAILAISDLGAHPEGRDCEIPVIAKFPVDRAKPETVGADGEPGQLVRAVDGHGDRDEQEAVCRSSFR